jgi:hypothetical protein
MASSTWRTITHQGQERNVRELTAEGDWCIAVAPQPDAPKDSVLILRGDSVIRTAEFGAPNAASVTANGVAVIADWIEFGAKTDSEIHVTALPDGESRSMTIPHSAPLVVITPDGSSIGISSYDGTVDIYETESLSLRSRHSVLFGDRLVPWTRSTHNQRIFLREKNDDKLEYSIDLAGNVQSMSEAVEHIRYVESFDIDQTSDWDIAIPELVTQYQEADSDYIKNRIANTVGDASLAHIDEKNRLASIIDVLEDALTAFEGPHEKLAAAILSDAHYRFGKQCDTEGNNAAFVEHLDTAEIHAKTVLPWYDGKDLLAKIYRRRARFYKKRGDRRQARQNIERIFELEKEYDVSLATDADERLRTELSS